MTKSYTTSFILSPPPSDECYEVELEGSVRCHEAEYEDGFEFYPAYNEVDDEFVVVNVYKDGKALKEFDAAEWYSRVDEVELNVRIREINTQTA